MSETANLRGIHRLIRALVGICMLVAANQARVAIVLHGWKKEWQPEIALAVSLVPWVVIIGIFGWLIWRDRQRRQSHDPAPKRRWLHWPAKGNRRATRRGVVINAILG